MLAMEEVGDVKSLLRRKRRGAFEKLGRQPRKETCREKDEKKDSREGYRVLRREEWIIIQDKKKKG